MENDNILNKRITFLKNNIQEIINKCSSSNDKEFISTLDSKKQEYMSELETVMKEFKLYKNKLRKERDYKKIMRTNDTMEYNRIKNKPNSNELMNELKKKREIAQNDFEKMQKIEENYSIQEQELCPELPGFLFFHKDINNTYGICPYILLNKDIKKNRLNWLDTQDDNGQLYRYLYDKYILKVEHISLLEQRDNLDAYFIKLHNDYLSESQLELLNNSKEYLKEYINSSVKTKKLKDKFKIIVNNISNIVIETGLDINEYISLYYGMYIPVNIRKDTIISDNKLFISTIYNDKLAEYKNILESIETSNRFLNNSTNNLKQELYQYIYNQQHVKKVSLNQKGKYFKKWSQLLDEEKLDRFYSFIEYFINKYLVDPGLVKGLDIETLMNSVKNLISNNFKRIKFKDLKWNVKKGIVENIYTLKFKEEDKSFYLSEEKEQESKLKTKKISSVRSLFNKDTEKIINEELVIFMINAKKNKKLNIDNIKTLKDEFIERLKTKLHIKRVNINDKTQVFKKFDDIYNVIINNDSSSSG
jgi:hypothetical protein